MDKEDRQKVIKMELNWEFGKRRRANNEMTFNLGNFTSKRLLYNNNNI